MAAYYLWFRLNHKTQAVIPESEGYAPPSSLDPKHPYHWTVVVDVRGRVVVRERDHVIATGTWQGDWDVVEPKTRIPLVPTTEQWVFIAEHLRQMIASPLCKQHPATPDMIDDGQVDEVAPVVHHTHPKHHVEAPTTTPPPPPPKKMGVLTTILASIALLLIVAGVIVYYVVIKPTVTHPNRKLGESCTMNIQCSSDHCRHLTCVER